MSAEGEAHAKLKAVWCGNVREGVENACVLVGVGGVVTAAGKCVSNEAQQAWCGQLRQR